MNSEELLKKYKEARPLYEDFAERINGIIQDVLDLKEINYLSIEDRAKTEKSLRGKLEIGKIHPGKLQEINDLAGVRIIVFVQGDIKLAEDVISQNFVAKRLSTEERLDTDRVGYRSHHWTLSLPKERTKLPEYEKFLGLKAELQIRTILEHAWAQIGHDQIYKPSAILPLKIKRDFTLLSGLLEIADNEFSRISEEIDSHENEVAEKTKRGDLNILLDSISLRQYFDSRFKSIPVTEPLFGPNDDMAEEIIGEFRTLGIDTLEKLEAVIPKEFEEKLQIFEKDRNYSGIARNLMIIHNPQKYFEEVWKGKWSFGPNENLDIYRAYKIDIDNLCNEFGVKISKK